MQPKLIIGLSGKIGTGKTTLADLLCGHLDGVRMSFADALREEVRDCYGVPMELMLTQEGKNTVVADGHTVRDLLQMHGVFRREGDPDYWTRKLDDRIDASTASTVIIDDVRFQNEAQLVRALGFLIRVNPFQGWAPGPNAGHVSETALDDFALFDLWICPPFGKLEEIAQPLASWLMTRQSEKVFRRQIREIQDVA